MPELYPDAAEGPYTVPSGTDIADGPQAFRDFADSLGGLSDTLEVFELAGDHTVTAVEMGGLFTHSGSGMTLTIEEDAHPVGSVCAVSNLSAEADAVVTVETPNLTESVGQYAITSFTQVQQNVWIPNGGSGGGGDSDGGDKLPGADATGGDNVYFVDNYLNTGRSYKVHEFTSPGTFKVNKADVPMRVLWVAAGGAGGSCNTSVHGAAGAPGGGAGRVAFDDAFVLTPGSYEVEVGPGITNGNGPDTTAFGQTCPGGGMGGSAGGGAGANGGSGGGGGGSHGAGGSGGAQQPGSPMEGLGANGGTAPANGMQHREGGNAGGTQGPSGYHTSDITGASANYGVGGAAGGGAGAPVGYGAGGNGGNNARGKGGDGVVIIAYPVEMDPPTYNLAIGGSMETVSNYNGTGQEWNVHTFEVANDQEVFNVVFNPQPFEVLIVAGGNGIGYFAGSVSNGGEVVRTQMDLSGGNVATVGAGGSSPDPGVSPPGKASNFNGVTAAAGGSTATTADTITGASVDYGGNGNTTGVRGRGQVGVGGSAKSGQPGIIVIAYQVGDTVRSAAHLEAQLRSLDPDRHKPAELPVVEVSADAIHES